MNGVSRNPGKSCFLSKAAAEDLQTGGSVIRLVRLSVLFGQHDRDHALGDRRVSRIGGVVAEALVVVVDLEQDRVAVGVEAAKIVLLVGTLA